jgi:hypothetical protein
MTLPLLFAESKPTGNARSSGYDRNADDWYVESADCVTALLNAVPELEFHSIHDPCCGMGTIPAVIAARGWKATGADLVDRANGKYPVQDFLTDTCPYDNIVTNPPFSLSVPIVRHALGLVRTGGRVVIVAQAKFLYSQGRHPLFTSPECERVLILSKRPSMPPGEMLLEQGESCRGGGAMDYCWVVFRAGKTVPGCSIEWLL